MFARWVAERMVAATITVLLQLAPCAQAATPCSGMVWHPSATERGRLEPAMARQFGVPRARILNALRLGTWSILYTETDISDEPSVFYHGDPRRGFVTQWSGAATIFDTPEVERWVRQHAPGIPTALARCFAWHVTQDAAPR